jgi:hypothetical protein
MGHLQFEALITTARLSTNPNDLALVTMLGLRIFEACGANINDFGEEDGHRVLRVRGKGGRVVLVPLHRRWPERSTGAGRRRPRHRCTGSHLDPPGSRLYDRVRCSGRDEGGVGVNGYGAYEQRGNRRRRVTAVLVMLVASLAVAVAQLSRPGVALGANVVNETFQFPLAINLNTCTVPVEPVALHGRLHIVVTSTVDKRGGYHVGVHSNTQSVTGVGLITGQTYTSSTQTEHQFYAVAPFPVVEMETDNYVLVSRSGTANTTLRTTVRVTVNADGVPTAALDDTRTGCSG